MSCRLSKEDLMQHPSLLAMLRCRLLLLVALVTGGWLACASTALLAAEADAVDESSFRAGAVFHTADSLAERLQDSRVDSQACLTGLCWQPTAFDVRLEKPWKHGELCVTFPSPRPVGNADNDTVAMEWYIARDDAGQPRLAPACVVVHESGRGMDVGRLIARSLNVHGLHTFLIHLPWYGKRQPEGGKPTAEMVLPALSQGIADVRRAHDAVAALPCVDRHKIAVQGTSLGGFVTATASGLDQCYDSTFILLAGGDLAGIIQHGSKDAAKFRDNLIQAGLTDAQISAALHSVEPLRIAHRLNPVRTWLYSGLFDDVVPPKHCDQLAEAAALAEDHHLKLHATHYSGIVYLPVVLAQIHAHITAE